MHLITVLRISPSHLREHARTTNRSALRSLLTISDSDMQHVSAGPFAVANVDPRRKFGSTAKSQLTTMSDFFDATNHIELTDIDEPTCFRPKAFTAPLHRAMQAEIGHQMILEYKLLSVELADCVGRLDESLAATAMLTNNPTPKNPPPSTGGRRRTTLR
jgi:hypothetical protein